MCSRLRGQVAKREWEQMMLLLKRFIRLRELSFRRVLSNTPHFDITLPNPSLQLLEQKRKTSTLAQEIQTWSSPLWRSLHWRSGKSTLSNQEILIYMRIVLKKWIESGRNFWNYLDIEVMARKTLPWILGLNYLNTFSSNFIWGKLSRLRDNLLWENLIHLDLNLENKQVCMVHIKLWLP